jgi:hypothetical protein
MFGLLAEYRESIPSHLIKEYRRAKGSLQQIGEIG